MHRRAFLARVVGFLAVAGGSAVPAWAQTRRDPADPSIPERSSPPGSGSWMGSPAASTDGASGAATPHSDAMESMPGMSTEPAMTHGAGKKAMYTCPMHPEVRENHPGSCPKCGMTLIPLKS